MKELVSVGLPAPVPFAHTTGPQGARIMIVGEAFGASEADAGRPFVGESGKELFRMLAEAWPQVEPALHSMISDSIRNTTFWLQMREDWFKAASVLLTNVFPLRPPDNKIEALCAKKGELPSNYSLPALSTGKYVRPEFLPELERLRQEIIQCNPNVVVAMGNTACWALLGSAGISSLRGVVHNSKLVPGIKVLPTYHPAGVLRNWSWRPITIVDLQKALFESKFKEIVRPQRTVLVNPTLDEIAEWFSRPAARYACDIETGRQQIKCVGFSRNVSDAIVVPFFDMAAPGASYWGNPFDEAKAWGHVRQALEGSVPKVFQNGLYDMQYLARMGFRMRNVEDDTMLLHHSMYPELQKGLGFLGSIYTSEASWKLMRKEKVDSEKRDE